MSELAHLASRSFEKHYVQREKRELSGGPIAQAVCVKKRQAIRVWVCLPCLMSSGELQCSFTSPASHAAFIHGMNIWMNWVNVQRERVHAVICHVTPLHGALGLMLRTLHDQDWLNTFSQKHKNMHFVSSINSNWTKKGCVYGMEQWSTEMSAQPHHDY